MWLVSAGISARKRNTWPKREVPLACQRTRVSGRARVTRRRQICLASKQPILTHEKTARRTCRETHLSTQQSEASPQAWVPRPYLIQGRPRRSSVTSGQGPASSECVISSIARRRTFAELRRDGHRARHGAVRLSFLPLEVDHPQVAFAIGKSFGNAVERNRGRRRLRAAFVEVSQKSELSTGSVDNAHFRGAFLLTGNRGLLTQRYVDLVRDVEKCLEKLAT